MLESKDYMRLARDAHGILSDTPGLTTKRLRALLSRKGWPGITKSDINSNILFSFRSMFYYEYDSERRWYSYPSAPCSISEALPLPAPLLPYYKGYPPRDWQTEAFDAWRRAGHRGVVEAVTGTGKTKVGILAAADAVARGLRVLIIVPGLVLLDQWYKDLNADLPALAIGRYGHKSKETLYDHHIIVSTVQSAIRQIGSIFPHGQPGLLIADEVHHYSAEKFKAALDERYDERLGLTATYERDVDNLGVLTTYFWPKVHYAETDGAIVAGCDYKRGLKAGILAPFKVALVGVDFSMEEREEYDELNRRISQYRSQLIDDFDCPSEPFDDFMREVRRRSQGNNGNSEMTRCASSYLKAFQKRKKILAAATAKGDALEKLGPILRKSVRALVFTNTLDGTGLALEALLDEAIDVLPYEGRMSSDLRKDYLTRFLAGKIQVLVAPRVLDEGIDLPEADIGVIVAASRSRRQMIQRMGRIIRPKKDGHSALFIILYVRDTSEDPKLGAHEAFLSEMQANAQKCEYIDLDQNPEALDNVITE